MINLDDIKVIEGRKGQLILVFSRNLVEISQYCVVILCGISIQIRVIVHVSMIIK